MKRRTVDRNYESLGPSIMSGACLVDQVPPLTRFFVSVANFFASSLKRDTIEE